MFDTTNGYSFNIFPDLNIVIEWIHIIKGGGIETNAAKNAACLMAFSQCLNINLDPTIAFSELAAKKGVSHAQTEYGWFLSADAANPMGWIQAALKGTPFDPVQPKNLTASWNIPTRVWDRNYILVLKLAEIQLGQGSPIQKILALMSWMREKFVARGPGIIFSIMFLSERARIKNMIKYIKSTDRERAIGGAQNAAWDITNASAFVDQVALGKTDRYLFASFDKALRAIANKLFNLTDEEDSELHLKNRLLEWWDESEAQIIARECLKLFQCPVYKSKNLNASEILSLKFEGELALRSWSPTQTN